jgi:co-chaperonin GroES (HSP10)
MIGANVLIAETEMEKKTQGGIILGTDARKGSKPGLVIMAGPEATHLKKGDRVFLEWSKSMPVDVDGRAAVIISMEFIKAVL